MFSVCCAYVVCAVYLDTAVPMFAVVRHPGGRWSFYAPESHFPVSGHGIYRIAALDEPRWLPAPSIVPDLGEGAFGRVVLLKIT